MPGKKVKKSPSVSRSSWVAVEWNDILLPSWKVERCSSSPHELDGVGYITENSQLHAIVTHVQLDTESSLPHRSDSVYLHPDTMRQCDFKIAEPIFIYSLDKQRMAIAKPWPLKSIDLDQIGCSKSVIQSCGSCKDSLVQVSSVTKEFPISHMTAITLNPISQVVFPLNDAFKSYFLYKNDGVVIIEGNVLSVWYHGSEILFIVDSFSLVESPHNVISKNSSNINDSLVNGFSHMTINGSRSYSHMTSGESHMTSGESYMTVNSTPVMNKINDTSLSSVDTSIAHPILHNDLSLDDHMTPELNHMTPESKLHKESLTSTPLSKSRVIHDLGLEHSTAGKLTMSTKISFVKNEKPSTPVRVSLSSVGGLKKQLRLLKELVLQPLSDPAILVGSGVHFPHGVLLYGPPGTGKSLLTDALVSEATNCTIFNVLDMLMGGEIEAKIEQMFSEAEEKAPSLIVINEVDLLCPHRELNPSENERRSTGALIKCLDSINHKPPQLHVVVIATTNRLDSVNASLRRPCRFDIEIEITVPSMNERKEILDILLKDVPNSLNSDEVEKTAQMTHGHVGADLKAVCREAQYFALRKVNTEDKEEGVRETPDKMSLVCIEYDDIRKALSVVRPSAMREVTIEVPKVLWSDIGGEEEIKQKLREAVEWPLTHPEAFARLGIQPPRGVLLYGPPGCSKTMIAQALATESGLNFISVKGPELFSKWVGDSERAVRQVFSRARAAAPAIIFFDEIDALATHRQGEGSKVGDRVLAQLLTEMDGVEKLQDVLIVAATNRPDIIDKALLRPGRIDRLIYVPLPSAETRKDIFQIQFRKTPVAEDVNTKELVELSENFSGAELVALVQEAALQAMHEDLSSVCVAKRHFMQALKLVKPQTDLKSILFYEKYNIL